METKDMKAVPVLSLKKALDMLDILAFEDVDRQGFGLSDLARRMGMVPNTARNLLKTMIVCGFVAQDEAGKYITGIKCRQLGATSRRQVLVELASPFLQVLSARMKEVVLLTVLSNGQRLIIAQVDPLRSIRVDPTASPTASLYAFATGRVLMAFADNEEQRQIVDRHGFPGAEWDGINSERKLQAAIELIRRQGVCVIKKRKEGLLAFAVPVLSGKGALIGALGCYAPAFRCPDKQCQFIVSKMRQSAAALSEHLAAQY